MHYLRCALSSLHLSLCLCLRRSGLHLGILHLSRGCGLHFRDALLA